MVPGTSEFSSYLGGVAGNYLRVVGTGTSTVIVLKISVVYVDVVVLTMVEVSRDPSDILEKKR